MPLSLKDLQTGVRTIPVKTIAGDVEITYSLGQVTEAFFTAHDKPGMAGVIETLVAWLQKWDVMDEGKMYPITIESLQVLPRAFILEVYAAINQDTHLRPTKKGGSFGGS